MLPHKDETMSRVKCPKVHCNGIKFPCSWPSTDVQFGIKNQENALDSTGASLLLFVPTRFGQ